MIKNIFTKKTKAVLFAALIGLASCQTDELVNPEKENQLLETSSSQLIEGQYIVVLKQEAVNGRISKSGDYNQRTSSMRSAISPLLRRAGVSDEAVKHVYSSTIVGFSASLNEDMLKRLQKSSEVSYIEQDRIITLAPPWERDDDGGSDSGQETPYGITRVGGFVDYSDNSAGNYNNVAWVIDSGIDLDHPDLNVDASRGFNAFTTGRDGKTLDDGNGHGTHVAGTIAAIDNTEGVVGVAAGATVIPVKVLDSRGSGTYSGVLKGIDHVAANGKAGDVANMSLGGGASDALDAAVVEASNNGIYFSIAAGNDGEDSNNHSPARANGDYIVTISAMDSNDFFASWSNWGNPPVDYCAPGVGIKSTWKDGGYNTISGTSMAAPHAAGVLLVTGGNPSTDGYVNGETKDDVPDPIIHQ